MSLQAPHSKRTISDDIGGGRFRRIMKIGRISGTSSSSLLGFERKRLRRNDDLLKELSVKESTFCSSEELIDTFSGKATISTKSSSFDVRREVARHILTSLLSDEDETMGPHPRNKVDCTCNDDGTKHTFLKKSETDCNVYESSLPRLQSYDDTVFDGIVEDITPIAFSKNESIFMELTEGNDEGRNIGAVDIPSSTRKYWPSVDMKTCLQSGLIDAFQKAPESNTITWQHKVVLSPLSY